MDFVDPGVAFLGRPTAPSGSVFREKVWPPPAGELELPLRPGSAPNLSSIVDDVMGRSDEDSVTTRLLSANRERRESGGSGYWLTSHSRDPSTASNTSDTPLLSRPLAPNWQNRSRVTFADESPRSAVLARETNSHSRISSDAHSGSGGLMESASVAGSGTSLYSAASAMRSRGEDSHDGIDDADGSRLRELPPLYHSIIPDPVPGGNE